MRRSNPSVVVPVAVDAAPLDDMAQLCNLCAHARANACAGVSSAGGEDDDDTWVAVAAAAVAPSVFAVIATAAAGIAAAVAQRFTRCAHATSMSSMRCVLVV